MNATAAVRGLTLGLSAGAGCLGICLPIAAPALFGGSRPGLRQSALALGLFLIGRLAAYLSVGLTSGLLGSIVGTTRVYQTGIIPVAYGLLGIFMVLFGTAQAFPDFGLCHLLRPAVASGWFPFLLGFLAGISPCPPFLLAVAAAIETGNIPNALLFFAAFYLATSVYLLPLLFSGWASRFGPVRTAARIIAIIVGLYFASVGVMRLLNARG